MPFACTEQLLETSVGPSLLSHMRLLLTKIQWFWRLQTPRTGNVCNHHCLWMEDTTHALNLFIRIHDQLTCSPRNLSRNKLRRR